ncbi:hypothetical protein D3C87_242330 [compost metagenome]
MIRELLSTIYLKRFSAWVFTCILLVCFEHKINAQTVLNQGDISIVGFKSTSPRTFSFVTWVPLASNTEILFAESGFNNSTPSTNAENIRWRRPYGYWTNTTGSVVPAGTVIVLEQEVVNFGSFEIYTPGGQTSGTALALLSSGSHLFAFQGGTIPPNGDKETFNGKILFGLGYRGSSSQSTWLSVGPANSNFSCLPSNLTTNNHVYIASTLSQAQYTGVRSGKTLSELRTLVASPASWNAATDFNVATFAVRAPTATGTVHTGTLQVGQTLTGDYDYEDPDGNAENGSTFKWYRSDNAAGLNKTAIASATAKTYVLVTADLNKHISFEVTPRDLTEVVGVAAESSLRGPITSGVLPVVLSSFIVRAENNMVKLNWQTTSETNNKGFIIYRSGDDKQVIQIGEISARANESSFISLYAFTDKQPLNGNNYYKLVQVDLDGKQTELGEKVINFNFSGAAVEVSPNPTEGKVTVRFNSGSYQVLTVVGLDGKVLQTLKLQPTSSNAEIDLTGYAKGVYFVKLSGNGVSDVQKVVKQ